MTTTRLSTRAARSLTTTTRESSATISVGTTHPEMSVENGWLCAGTDNPEAFHPVAAAAIPAAEALCDPCPRKVECLDLGRRLRGDGVWGGTFLESGKPATKRPVGRPRKGAPAA